MSRDRLAGALRVVLIGVVLEMLVLVATGLYLTFRYVPKIGGATLQVTDVVREIHRICASVTLATTAALLVLVLVRAWPSQSARVRRLSFLDAGIGTGLVVLMVVGLWTGRRLPWDQLAVYAVTVGSRYAGYSFLWRHDVRFAVAANRELSTASLLHRFLFHVFASGLGSAVLLVAAWVSIRPRLRRSDRRRTRPSTDQSEEEPAAYLN